MFLTGCDMWGLSALPKMCMWLLQGHWSPIVKQMRQGRKPEGICIVCGSCATGFPPEQNRQGLLFFADTTTSFVAGIKCLVVASADATWQMYPQNKSVSCYIVAIMPRPASTSALLPQDWALSRTGDFLHTFTDAAEDMQLFWEAFPAEGGAARTTYMFTYCDTDKRRPTFQAGLST